MFGFIITLIAGMFMSIQSIFNTKLGEKVGMLESTFIVHSVGLLTALFLVLLFGKGSLKEVAHVKKVYLIGGMFGVGIVFGVMKSFQHLGPMKAMSLLVISQLCSSLIIETFGLFGAERISLTVNKPLGILIMIIGFFVLKR